MYIAKECKVVNGLVPQDVNGAGAVSGTYVSMKGWDHLTVILHLGAVGAASAVTLTQAQDVSATGAKALSFNYQYNNVGLTTDTFTETAVASNTFNHSANANNIYLIEIEARQLDTANNFDCVQVNVAAQAGAATLMSIIYVLSGSRYSETALSAITD